jgi:undecaprenyl-diphosphatase
MTLIQVIILAIIEGITEFLPISSTGHMIIAAHYMNIENQTLLKSFEVIIQFGAILSVVILYKKKFLSTDLSFYKKLIFAFIPTGIIGFILKNKIESWLGSVQIVAWALIVGGVVLIACDYIFKPQNQTKKIDDLNLKQSAALGFFQSLALIPGVSRSGATIVGGLFMKLSKKEAAEFSFFLAVPTMAAATLYKSIKIIPTINMQEFGLITIGSLVAFLVAYVAIKTFIHIVGKYGFLYFGVYRIVLGAIILILG